MTFNNNIAKVKCNCKVKAIYENNTNELKLFLGESPKLLNEQLVESGKPLACPLLFACSLGNKDCSKIGR